MGRSLGRTRAGIRGRSARRRARHRVVPVLSQRFRARLAFRGARGLAGGAPRTFGAVGAAWRQCLPRQADRRVQRRTALREQAARTRVQRPHGTVPTDRGDTRPRQSLLRLLPPSDRGLLGADTGLARTPEREPVRALRRCAGGRGARRPYPHALAAGFRAQSVRTSPGLLGRDRRSAPALCRDGRTLVLADGGAGQPASDSRCPLGARPDGAGAVRSACHLPLLSSLQKRERRSVSAEGGSRMLTPDEEQFFLENGYFHARGVLAGEYLASIQSEFDRVWELEQPKANEHKLLTYLAF